MERSYLRFLVAITALLCVASQNANGFVVPDTDDSDSYLSSVPIEEIIKGAAESPDDLNFFFDNENRLVKEEYDMILPLEDWIAMHPPHRQKRTAAFNRNAAKRWTNNTVYYESFTSEMDRRDRHNIDWAMTELSHYTCLTFTKNNRARNILRFYNGRGCYSYIGMRGGIQILSLAKNCRVKRVIQHELLHAIGIHHEQTRPDRDEYVTVNLHRVSYTKRHNFEKFGWDKVMDLNLPYDYESIMHYSGKAFSYTGTPTIVTKDEKYQDKIGKYKDLSFFDVKTLNLMHDCGKNSPECTLRDEDCPGQGFVGKDCRCWCPGKPVQYCFDEDKKNRADLTEYCHDKFYECQDWARRGSCRDIDYYRTNCSKSCKLCQP